MPVLTACGSIVLASTAAVIAYLRRQGAPRRAFPTPAGPHRVLAVAATEINLDSFGCSGKLRAQLLSPCFAGEKQPPKVEYYRASALKALPFAFIPPGREGLRANAWQAGACLVYGFLRIAIGWQRHPDSGACSDGVPGREGERSTENGAAEKKLPLVIFSHGLYGNMHMYTQLCRELASYGCVVIALEHQDGTATGTLELPYRSKPGWVDYNDRDTVRRFRDSFLQRREDEVSALLRYLRETSPAELPSILRVADHGCVILAGHSFGAAGVVRALKSNVLRDSAKLALLYDTWAWPLKDDDVVPGSIPSITMLSEQFRQGKELHAIAQTLGQSTELGLWWLPETSHQCWSDFVWLLPTRINHISRKRDPRPAHNAMVGKTFAALDKVLGRSTPQPAHPAAAIMRCT